MTERDVEGLVRLLAMADFSDLEGTAYSILDSEWLLRQELAAVRSFLEGCLKGVSYD